jgi:PAS domain S-box-containing protein
MLMKDEDKPREQLISEITELRQQLGESKSSLEELKKSEAKDRMLAEATPAFVHVTQGKRRQTEDQLRAAHQQLSEIIEFLPDATLVIDKGRRVIAWNKAIEEMTGVRKEETIGKGNHAYAVPFYGEPRPILIDLVFMEDGETAQKYTYTEKVGDTIYAETFIPSLYEGRGAYLWVKASPLYSSEGLGQRMGELINDILDLSCLSRKEMQLQEVNLSQLAASIAIELQSMEPERQVNFIITPNLEVRGDKQLLQSVLENLMNNAWKFTSKHPQAKIKFGVKKNGGKKAYFVRGDGAGFDMKYAQKLFGAFQRLHTIGEFPGTGVGLAIVQRIVHRHGGQVWAEGAEEKGATFYFTLNRQISGRG